MFFDGPFSCIWWHKTQLEVLFGAKGKGSSVEKPNTVKNGALCFLTVSRWIFLGCALCGTHFYSVFHYLYFVDFRGNVMD